MILTPSFSKTSLMIFLATVRRPFFSVVMCASESSLSRALVKSPCSGNSVQKPS